MILGSMFPARLDAVNPVLRQPAPPEGLTPLDGQGLAGVGSGISHRTRAVLSSNGMPRIGVSPPGSGSQTKTPLFREGSSMYSDADDGQRKKKKRCLTFKSVFNFLYLVMKTSSIHGFNHMTDEKRHILERMVWFVFLVLGCWGAVEVSRSTWKHYQENPTVISMERDYKEWNTSFPSVTICPTVKYDEAAVEAKAEEMTHIQDKERLKLFLMKLANATYDTFGDVPNDFSDEIKPSEYMDLVLAVKLDFSYTVSGSNTEANTVGALQTTITEHGLCYAFNSDIAVYNSPEYFKSKNNSLVQRAWSFYGSPLDGDVFAQVMDMNSGYLVYLHSSNETADFASQRLESPSGSYKTLDISALSIYTSEDAASLDVPQRRCRFLVEPKSPLILSPVYSYNLCRNECRMKLAHRRCGCVPHFYRPVHKYRICDVKGMHCLAKETDLMSTLRDPVTKKKVKCNCLPPCDDVNYIIENDHTMPWFLGTNLKWGMTKYPRMRLKRDVIFGFIDVLVSVGGTAGLFLGCSVLSLIEIVYFFTLKAFFYVLEHRNDDEDDEDEEGLQGGEQRPDSGSSGDPAATRIMFAPRSFAPSLR
ncbi:sodium channel protein Nach-like [Frankliniella occidentalis]|uniref:Sodium channel protein Nach-like n=1 Tax=Frankliniella occidentalis TaxID=133901 RepID=A0A6J1SNX7_FRAOC|nr:sodium channel protein Nach-like [Frankliniella occidentalis]